MCGSISVIQGLLQAEQTQSSHSRIECAFSLYSHNKRDELLTENQLQTLLSSGLVDWIADDYVGWEHGAMMQSPFLSILLAECPTNESFFETQRRSSLPNWDNLCKGDKFDFMSYAMGWPAKTVRRLLNLEGPIQGEDIQKWKEEGVSLLHWSIMWFSTAESIVISPTVPRKYWTEWQELLTEIIGATGTNNLHLMETYNWQHLSGASMKETLPATFLLCFFRAVGRWFIDRRSQASVEARLDILLGAMMSCGIDLEAYGRREFDIWEHEYGSKHIRPISCVKVHVFNWTKSQPLGSGSYWTYTHSLMVAIHYGPKLEDWIIEWDRCWDYAEVFWNMVENPLQVEVMPGSWIDTDELDKRPLDSSYPWIPSKCE